MVPPATRRELYPGSRKRRFPLGGRPSKDYLQGDFKRGPNRVNSSLLVAGGCSAPAQAPPDEIQRVVGCGRAGEGGTSIKDVRCRSV